MTIRTKRSRLSSAILEMAADQHRLGVMDDSAYRKIITRQLGPEALRVIASAKKVSS
jgi:putative transcriptional regulator